MTLQLLLLVLFFQAITPSTHNKRIAAQSGAVVDLWDSGQSRQACNDAGAENCAEGVRAQLTNGTLVVVLRGLPGASKKEKALKCDDLTPIRVVGGPHDGKIGCVLGSALAER